MSATSRDMPSERRFTGRHLLYLLLGFFGVMLVANAIFIWLALDTFTGVSSENAYQDGLNYNQRLEAAAEQRSRGWQGTVSHERDRVDLKLVDAAGQPVRGLVLEALFLRPTHDSQDRLIAMTETEPGRYSVSLSLPASGNWDLVIRGYGPDGAPFETRQRLWVE